MMVLISLCVKTEANGRRCKEDRKSKDVKKKKKKRSRRERRERRDEEKLEVGSCGEKEKARFFFLSSFLCG